MKKYEENMKKYEGITLPIYVPWDLEKFRARPAGRRGKERVCKIWVYGGGVGERKDMKHVNMKEYAENMNKEKICGKHEGIYGTYYERTCGKYEEIPLTI